MYIDQIEQDLHRSVYQTILDCFGGDITCGNKCNTSSLRLAGIPNVGKYAVIVKIYQDFLK